MLTHNKFLKYFDQMTTHYLPLQTCGQFKFMCCKCKKHMQNNKKNAANPLKHKMGFQGIMKRDKAMRAVVHQTFKVHLCVLKMSYRMTQYRYAFIAC